MGQLRLKLEDRIVSIIDKNQGDTIYTIRKSELARTIDEGLSEWIMQLLEKTWITTELLYQLALLIKKEFPKNSIDWYKTSFVVEKSNYLNSLGDVMISRKESLTASAFEEIKFGRKESNEETHTIIREIVYKRLEELGL